MKYIYRAHLDASQDVAVGVKKITIQLEEAFSYKPWQYVWVEIPQLAIPDPQGSRRAFSILNAPNADNKIDILLRASASGYKQSIFALEPGAPLRIHGPFGSSFAVSEDHHPEQIIMLAGGVGIAPFYKMAELVSTYANPPQLHLIYLNKSEEQTPFLHELEEQQKYKHFSLHTSYQPLAADDLKKLPNITDSQTKWWIAGPQKMVDYSAELLTELGVVRPNMFFETYYPSQPNNLTLEQIKQQTNEQSMLTQALQNSTNHTIITDANGLILFANQAAQSITGYSLLEMIGNTPRLWGGTMSPEFYREFWRKKSSGEAFKGEITNRRKNGELYVSLANIAPIFDDEHHIIGYIGTEEDITELKQKEFQITQSEQRLKFALEGSRDGLWDWDIPSRKLYLSPRWKQILGYRDDELTASLDMWESHINPDELQVVAKSLRDHMVGDADYYQSEHRMLCKDGTYKWVLDRGIVTSRDKNNKPLRIVGTQTDISESKEREKMLEDMNAAMVGRELKMVELKKELEKLRGQLGQAGKTDSPHA